MTTHVTRRTMLRGMGAALALPWMESLPAAGRAAAKSADAAGPDVLLVRSQRRAPADLVSRSNEGALVDLPETLRPLSFARDYLNCFHGLTHNTALTNGDTEGCGHGQGSASFLTGAQAYKTQDAVRVGISVDQLYARHVGNETRFPSLELGCESARSGNAFGYSGTYKTHISWRTPTSPAPYEMNPKVVFDRLFTQGKQQPDAGHGRRSRLLPQEHARLRARRCQPHPRPRRQDRSAQARPVPDRRPRSRAAHPACRRRRPSFPGTDFQRPAGIPEDFDEHLRLMCDLMVLAFQTDSTRASTFMVTKEATDRNYPWLGFTDGHHELSHHARRRREEPQTPRDRPLPYLDPGIHDRKDDDGRGGRRHDAARQLDGPLRQRHQRRRPARPCQPAGDRGRQRGRHAADRAAPEMPARDADVQLAAGDAASRRSVPVDRFGDSTEPLPGLLS